MARLPVSKSVCHAGACPPVTLGYAEALHAPHPFPEALSFDSLILWLATGFSGIKSVIFVFCWFPNSCMGTLALQYLACKSF